jgi:hypothetical protein
MARSVTASLLSLRPASARPRARVLSLGVLLLGVGLSGSAFAQDSDDFDLYDEDDDDDEPQPAPIKESGELDEGDPDDDEWMAPENDEPAEELDFDDDYEDSEDAEAGQGEGEDTARIYREALEEYSELAPDEEALAWERYLQRYPSSLFRQRIETRMDELNQEMYDDYIEDSIRTTDAGKSEIRFTQPMHLESIDPRSKLRAGFEWGYPDWINLMADLEWQLLREWSVHGGLRQRYTGYNVELGTKYALVKSTRMGLLVTGIGDFRLNTNPSHPAVRPQLGVGKRFRFGDQFLDAMVQAGSDLAIMNIDGSTGISPRFVGGANLSFAASEELRIYFETSSYMKDLGHDQIESFRFNQIGFGIRYVKRQSKQKEKFDVGAGAAAPYTINYWRYHFGEVAADVNYYLKNN